MMAANNYFMVVVLCMADRNKAFQGDPCFFNQAGLFIETWHVRFNFSEELPSRVPMWGRPSRLPLEF